MTVLRGNVSYTEGEIQYTWCASNNACEICKNLNGKTFDEISQIPNKPHPNCRCWIEDKNKSSKDDRKKLKDIMQNIHSDANSLKDEIFAINNNVSSSNFAPSQKKDYTQDLSDIENFCNDIINSTNINYDYTPNKELANTLMNLTQKLNYAESQVQIINDSFQKEQSNYEKNNKIDDKFANDFQKHNDLRQILQHFHDSSTPLPEGYKLEENYHNPKTQLDMQIYEHGNELILSFPGSHIPRDLPTDMQIIQNKQNPQLENAQEKLNDIRQNPKYENHKIITTGYSLGGNIAGGLSLMNNIEGVTFNPFGKLDDIIQQKANDTGKIIEIYPNKLINYRHENDKLSSKTQNNNPGQQYNLPKINKVNDPFNHDIKNISNSINRSQNNGKSSKTIYYPKLKRN